MADGVAAQQHPALRRALKFFNFNIGLVPLILTLGMLLLWFWRRRRSA